jgi:hypothetical protein
LDSGFICQDFEASHFDILLVRPKPSEECRYPRIVENTRDGAATRQRVLATLGRPEDFEASGNVDALPRSGARLSVTVPPISSPQAGAPEASATARIGVPMIFGRLWEQTGCAAVIERLAAGRGFGFSLERAVFASVLHRLTAWRDLENKLAGAVLGFR